MHEELSSCMATHNLEVRMLGVPLQVILLTGILLIVTLAFRYKSRHTPPSITSVLQAYRAKSCSVELVEDSMYESPTWRLANSLVSIKYVESLIGDARVEILDILTKRFGNRQVITQQNGQLTDGKINGRDLPLEGVPSHTNYQVHELFREVRSVVSRMH